MQCRLNKILHHGIQSKVEGVAKWKSNTVEMQKMGERKENTRDKLIHIPSTSTREMTMEKESLSRKMQSSFLGVHLRRHSEA